MSVSIDEVLRLLRYELNWLEQSQYPNLHGSSASAIPSPFLNNRSCLNFEHPLRPHTCRECLLSMFVPQEHLTEEIPCHHIPLNGETVASLIEKGDRAKLVSALKRWLKATIVRIETLAKANQQTRLEQRLF